jgi:ABC-2 type transport system ATP-binding protein
MPEEPPVRRVEVRFVGAPPARQVARASGVSEVEVDGPVLRCRVCGSFQPFLEALRGHEVVGFNAIPALAEEASSAPFQATDGPDR